MNAARRERLDNLVEAAEAVLALPIDQASANYGVWHGLRSAVIRAKVYEEWHAGRFRRGWDFLRDLAEAIWSILMVGAALGAVVAVATASATAVVFAVARVSAWTLRLLGGAG